jgi:LytS/YehU family sensor histidine kinase
MTLPAIFLFSLMIALVYFLKKTIELEAKYYHSQLLPHAVLNAMIFLQKSIINNNPDHAKLYFEYQTSYLQKILETEKKIISKLSTEIDQSKTFVKYYNVLNNSNYSIQFNINNLTKRDVNVPSLLFQPFLENVFKYEKNKHAVILVSINVIENWSNSIIKISIASDLLSNYTKKFVISKYHRGLQIANKKIKYTCSFANRRSEYFYHNLKIKSNAEGSLIVFITLPSTLREL